jgi:hypothetical protein
MDNFIALRCPSCGGGIQTEKNLEKIFCTHCGTQLILGQAADGLLVPLKARNLTASTALKDARTAQMLITYFKDQIADLEAETAQLRKTFLQYCVDHAVGEAATVFGGESKTNSLINRYTQAVTGKPQLTRKLLLKTGWHEKEGAHGAYGWHMEKIFALELPSLNTAEDFFNLYQFITQKQYYDKVACELARAIYPITHLFPELQENRQKLKQVMDKMTG